jgi:hypothetical protein
LSACLFSLLLTGCSGEPAVPEEKEHTHTASVGYRCDERHHWRPCTGDGCNIKLQWAEHVFDGGVITTFPTADVAGVKTYTCVCGQSKTEPVSLEDANNAVFDAEKMEQSLSNVSLRVTAKAEGTAEAQTALNLCFDGDLLSVSGTLRGAETTETVRDVARLHAYREVLFFFRSFTAGELRYDAQKRFYAVDRSVTAGGFVISEIGLRFSKDLVAYVTCRYESEDEVGTLEIALFDYGNIRLQ